MSAHKNVLELVCFCLTQWWEATSKSATLALLCVHPISFLGTGGPEQEFGVCGVQNPPGPIIHFQAMGEKNIAPFWKEAVSSLGPQFCRSRTVRLPYVQYLGYPGNQKAGSAAHLG